MSTPVWIPDPTGHFPKVAVGNLMSACGVLLIWLDEDDPRDAREQFDSNYPFGLIETRGGTVRDNGVYEYPEDPPLHPLMSCKLHDVEDVYLYQHAMVAIVRDGVAFVTRMD